MYITQRILLALLSIALTSGLSFGQVTSGANGDYSNNGTWVGNAPDESVDNVLILHDVILDIDLTIEQNFEVQGSLTGTSSRDIDVIGVAVLTVGSVNLDGDILVQNDAAFNVLSGDTVYVENLEFKNSALGIIEAGAVVYVNGDLDIKNNAIIILNGEIHVGNEFSAKNNSIISGNGSLYAGSQTNIQNGATIFGSTTECTNCVYSNGCTFSTIENIWNGSSSSDWFTASNWSNGIPAAKFPVRISSSATTMPVINAGAAECFHLTVESGASLEIAGSNKINIYGNFDVQGIFIANNSIVNFTGDCWPSEMTCSSTLQFYNLIIDNQEGLTMKSGSFELLNILQVSNGLLTTNDSLTIISNASGTGCIDEITGVGVSGKITMERYIDAGETYWRYFGSAVQGATIGDYNDDFVTAGYPGSWWPTFVDEFGNPWISIYSYEENLGLGLGYVGVSGSGQTIQPGQGLQVWCGDTIVGTQAFTVDLTGVPNQGNINMPVSFTNFGSAAEDGWNLVANPYPATIDWEDPDWTKVNMANAVYVQNPDNQQYATYVAGASTNGGTRYIASQQAFWVYAFASNPQLTATEGVKSTTDQSFFKAGQVLSPGLTIRLFGDQEFDEAIVRYVDGATDNFDYEYDAQKMWGGWGVYPQVSLISNNQEDLTVHSFDDINEEEIIPLRVIVFEDGIYNLEFENLSELDVPCIKLEDTYTGIIYDLNEGTVLPFFMDDTTYSPRFNLILGKNYASDVVDNSCFNESQGQIMLDLEMSTVNYDFTFNGMTLNETGSGDPLILNNLTTGIYTIEVPSLSNSCGVTTFNFVINEPSKLELTETVLNTVDGNDGSIVVMPNGGQPPYSFDWNNGVNNAINDGLNPGVYSVLITDANGCTIDANYEIISVLGIQEINPNELIVNYDQVEGTINVVNSGLDGEQEFLLYDAKGQLVEVFTVYVINGEFTTKVNDKLATGIYILNHATSVLNHKFGVYQ